jgi:hypothetical protein
MRWKLVTKGIALTLVVAAALAGEARAQAPTRVEYSLAGCRQQVFTNFVAATTEQSALTGVGCQAQVQQLNGGSWVVSYSMVGSRTQNFVSNQAAVAGASWYSQRGFTVRLIR